MKVLTTLLIASWIFSVAREPRREVQCALTDDRCIELILSTPDALLVKKNGGCPSAEIFLKESDRVAIQLRNSCPLSGTGMVANFGVSRSSGAVYLYPDGPSVDGDELRSTRERLCQKGR
jgi:hypothetical protein